ncbi:MAG: hypothetical protein ACQERC_09895 [Bacteroidota bacterium]
MNNLIRISIISFSLLLSSNCYSQKVSSVIISGTSHLGNVKILVVKPDYTSTYNKEHMDLYVELKIELDKWLEKGYEIKSSSSGTYTDDKTRHTYTLIKKE